jgi:hypothetical protein
VTNTCPVCARPLDQPVRGRPRRYCSIECRRHRENERRALEQRIDALERGLQYLTPDHLLRLAGTTQERERARLAGLLTDARLRLGELEVPA